MGVSCKFVQSLEVRNSFRQLNPVLHVKQSLVHQKSILTETWPTILLSTRHQPTLHVSKSTPFPKWQNMQTETANNKMWWYIMSVQKKVFVIKTKQKRVEAFFFLKPCDFDHVHVYSFNANHFGWSNTTENRLLFGDLLTI